MSNLGIFSKITKKVAKFSKRWQGGIRLKKVAFATNWWHLCNPSYSTVKDQQVGKMAPAPAIRLEQRDAICRCAREFGEVSSRKFEFG